MLLTIDQNMMDAVSLPTLPVAQDINECECEAECEAKTNSTTS